MSGWTYFNSLDCNLVGLEAAPAFRQERKVIRSVKTWGLHPKMRGLCR